MVIFGVGIPGSGKSTLLRAIAKEYDTAPIEIDTLCEQVRAEGHNNIFDEIKQRTDAEVAPHITRGGIAIIDSTNCYAEERLDDIKRYRSLGALTIGAIWLDTPKEIAVARNESRTRGRIETYTIDCMYAALSRKEPSTDEGFNWVIRVQE